MKRGSSVVAVDAHALDRAGRRALAAGNLRPLEGGARRRRGGEQPLAVAEHDFRIGADVDQEAQFVAEIGRLGQHDARGVGADMAGDAGKRIEISARRDVEADVARPRLIGAVDRERERRAAELGRIEAQHEVMHDRIADQGHLENLGPCDLGLACRLADQGVHRLAHGARQLGVAARIHHHIGDPAHEILAEADLRVHRADRGDDRAADEVAEMDRDGGRADVDGDAIGALGEARQDGDDVAALAQRHGCGPAALAKGLLQARERREIGMRIRDAPLFGERLLQAAKVARRVLHVRLADFDIVQPDDRIDVDRVLLGALAHDLAVDLALRRHVDDELAANLGLAAEPPPRRKRSALIGIALLDLAPGARVRGVRGDRVLGEFALGDVDLAAPANAAPAADRIEIDTERARRGEQARSCRELAPLARRQEDDAMRGQAAALRPSPGGALRAARRPRLRTTARDICGSRRRNWDHGPSRRRPRGSPGCPRHAADS